MYHLFSIEELKDFLKVKCLELKTFDEHLEFLEEFYTDSISWDRKLVSLNYFLSRILEQFEKEGIDNQTVINYIYSLQYQCNLIIQEGSVQFLESLFSNECQNSLSLEEQLIIAQNRIEK